MPRLSKEVAELERLAEKWTPILRRDWIDAVRRINSRIVLRQITELIERGDIDGAIRALGIRESDFGRLERDIEEAYHETGFELIALLPPHLLLSGSAGFLAWNIRENPGAEEVRRDAAQFVTGITEESRSGLREAIATSIAAGRPAAEIARDIAGRVNRVNGQREGGLVGLTRPQMQTVTWIRTALRSGDTEAMRRYLGLALRDKRLDSIIHKALAEGRGLTSDQAERAARLYANKALMHRATVIAEHEVALALDRARYQVYMNRIDAGELDPSALVKIWQHTPQERPRLQHVSMNGQVVRFDEQFTAPDGTRFRYPRDPNAPIRHTIGCKCQYRVVEDEDGSIMARYLERQRRGL